MSAWRDRARAVSRCHRHDASLSLHRRPYQSLKWLTASSRPRFLDDPLNRYIGERHANIRGHAKLPTVVSGVVPRQAGCIVGEPAVDTGIPARTLRATFAQHPAILARLLATHPAPSLSEALQVWIGPAGNTAAQGLSDAIWPWIDHRARSRGRLFDQPLPWAAYDGGRVVVGAPAASPTICT